MNLDSKTYQENLVEWDRGCYKEYQKLECMWLIPWAQQYGPTTWLLFWKWKSVRVVLFTLFEYDPGWIPPSASIAIRERVVFPL